MVRKIEYTVSESGIAPAVTQFGGVQSEHRATELAFNIESVLWTKLTELVASEGGELVYRFDGYDGEGGVHRSDTNTLTESVSYLLEEQLTRYGGTVRVVLVVSFVKSDTTEMELYSFPAMLKLKSLPVGTESDSKNRESLSTLAVVAKDAAETALKSADIATEAQEKTERARAALEGGTVWILDGGDSGAEIDLSLVIDDEMSSESENLVKNRVIKAYVDDLDKKFDGLLSERNIYPLEQGVQDGWSYTKYSNGYVECSTKYVAEGINDQLNSDGVTQFGYNDAVIVNLPFLFTEITDYQATGGSQNRINFVRSFGAFPYDTANPDTTNNVRFLVVSLNKATYATSVTVNAWLSVKGFIKQEVDQ